MRAGREIAGLAVLGILLGAAPALSAWSAQNHSFSIDPTSATVCLDGATFVGRPDLASALNVQLTSQVFDGLGNNLLATGDSHTFTAVNENFLFTVLYPPTTFNVGDAIGLSVTDTPGTQFGMEGDFDNSATVADCSLSVPTLPAWGFALLVLLLGVAGAIVARGRIGRRGGIGVALFLLALLVPAAASAGLPVPTFSKVFAPDPIGPGSTTTLTFTITNGSGSPVSDLAFTDTLPAGVTIATPALASTTCGGAPVLTAPGGGSTISFSGGTVGGSASCIVKVNVTSSTVGTHMNVSGALTSSAGNSGTATDDLVVEDDRPGFLKSFAPSTVALGGRSTLTFLIDNALNDGEAPNAGDVTFLAFQDLLPIGMVIADPNNLSTTCGGVLDITATPGTNLIDFFSLGSTSDGGEVVVGGGTCTVVVDVVANVAGALHNLTSDLNGTSNGADFNSGKATATLVSTATQLGIRKSFLDDPVPPGGTVTLQFRIDNRNRSFAATGVGFTDDLDFTPSMGITLAGGPTPDPPCGAGSTLTLAAGDVLTLAGGTVAPGGSCTFTVTLGVPVTETTGLHVNTTSAVTGTIDGAGAVGNMASDTLFVDTIPIFTKEFTDDPVGGGGTVTLEFTIANTDPSSTLTDIAFDDDLNTAILGLAANGLVSVSGLDPDPLVDPCGSGSELTIFDANDFGVPIPPNLPPDPTMLIFTGGSLAAAGSPGDSCTFSVVLDVPVVPGGIYTNTTDPLTADQGMTPVMRAPASGDLVVLGAPRLTKDFTDDPVVPGNQVTLEFTLTHNIGSPGDATGISFTDDLTTTGIAGLAAAAGELPKADLCGPGNGTLAGSAGDTLLTFSGGTLMPGDVCTFSLLLDVPAGAPGGTFTNTTSGVGATVDGVASTSRATTADLVIAQVSFSKEFTNDPVLPGGSVTLEFTLVNLGPDAATAISFTDDLDVVVSGLLPAAGEVPQVDPCGTGSALVSFDPPGPSPPDPSILHLTGGSLAAAGSVGDTCTFSVTLDVPAATADGIYPNLTSDLSATIDTTPTTLPPAFDALTVDSDLLFLTKQFTNDPVAPGDPVNLRFTIDNLDPDDPISSIAFSDDLDAALTGLMALGLPLTSVCGGTLSTTDGGLSVDFTGGSLPAGGSCFFDVTVSVPSGSPGPGPFINTTSPITGLLGGLPVSGGPASDQLKVDNLIFTKAFDGPSTATGTPKLTFTIQNRSASASAGDLSFTDNLDAVISGLVATGLPAAPCGAGSTITGSSLLTLAAGNLPPGGTCSFEVDLLVPATAVPGIFPNTTGLLRQGGVPVAGAATASLTIEPPPTFAKAFLPAAIGQGFGSTLTFTIDNTASAVAATGLTFSDTLPAGVQVSAVPAVVNTCGGTVTAAPSSTTIDLAGGMVNSGMSCTISVQVTAISFGVFVNVTGDLTSSSGNSGTATDTLTVAACTAADGVNLTLQNDIVLAPEFHEVCDTITVRQHFLVLGPNGRLTLRAGVAVLIENGVEIGNFGELVIDIDPSLVP